MKKSLKIVLNNPYPIQVTNFDSAEDLKSWIADFDKKHIEIEIRPNGNGSFAIFREVTNNEIDEIKAGKVIIRGDSFKELRPGDYL
ncbi:MAG: hypothetical protein KKB31_04655 [Nanoarchaeota archaeon]|nr:hypothetical protein [Nanoarchaeota archaeon]